MLSAIYAQAARIRRASYRRPGRRRRLDRPVISVGNLSVGGRGKTPTARHLVEVLRGMGERPAVLSRGYRRTVAADGVVVVHDGRAIRADLPRAGDEPLMLARALASAPVLVSPDRYLAGRLAELCLGATVHVLDDGFQHLPLHRDIDLLIVSPEDLDHPRTLPAGRLRESLAAASLADAVLAAAGDEGEAADLAGRLQVPEAFPLKRQLHPPLRIDAFSPGAPLEPGTRLLAVAGIARPGTFFEDARRMGLDLAGTMPFPDHHAYASRDVGLMAAEARRLGAGAIVTTEKDLVRLLPHRPLPLPVAWIPLSISIEPSDRFRGWLAARLAAARSAVR